MCRGTIVTARYEVKNDLKINEYADSSLKIRNGLEL